MNELTAAFLGIFQILIQSIAAYYSYRIYQFNRLNKWWIAITIGLLVMTLRRITALLIQFKMLPLLSGWISDLDRIILPTLISILLLVGLYIMFKNFEDFEIVEKKIKEKMGALKKKK